METGIVALIVSIAGWIFTWLSQVFLSVLNRQYYDKQRIEAKVDRAIENEILAYEEYIRGCGEAFELAIRGLRNIAMQIRVLVLAEDKFEEKTLQEILIDLKMIFDAYEVQSAEVKEFILSSPSDYRSLMLDENYGDEKVAQEIQQNAERVLESAREIGERIDEIKQADSKNEIMVTINRYLVIFAQYQVCGAKWVGSISKQKIHIIINIHREFDDI